MVPVKPANASARRLLRSTLGHQRNIGRSLRSQRSGFAIVLLVGCAAEGAARPRCTPHSGRDAHVAALLDEKQAWCHMPRPRGRARPEWPQHPGQGDCGPACGLTYGVTSGVFVGATPRPRVKRKRATFQKETLPGFYSKRVDGGSLSRYPRPVCNRARFSRSHGNAGPPQVFFLLGGRRWAFDADWGRSSGSNHPAR